MVKSKQVSQAKTAETKKKDNTLKIVFIVLGVFVGLSILSVVGLMIFFGSIFGWKDKNVTVNSDGEKGSVTIKSNDGQSATSYGENVQIPDGFPSDVPIYDPATLVSSSKLSEGQYSVSARTASTVSDVTSFYKNDMKEQGWNSQIESSYGDGTILSFKKGNRTASVTVSVQPQESSDRKTFFTVSTSDKQ